MNDAIKFKEGDIIVIKNSPKNDIYYTVCISKINSDNLIHKISTVCKSVINGSFPQSSFRLASKIRIMEFEKAHKKIIHKRVVNKIKGSVEDYAIRAQPLIDLIEINNAKNLLPKLLKEFKKVGYTTISIGTKAKFTWQSTHISPEMIFSDPDLCDPTWPKIWRICEKFGFSGCGNSQQYQCCSRTIKYNWKSIQGVYNLTEEK